jgi:hypothetical protein
VPRTATPEVKGVSADTMPPTTTSTTSSSTTTTITSSNEWSGASCRVLEIDQCAQYLRNNHLQPNHRCSGRHHGGNRHDYCIRGGILEVLATTTTTTKVVRVSLFSGLRTIWLHCANHTCTTTQTLAYQQQQMSRDSMPQRPRETGQERV